MLTGWQEDRGFQKELCQCGQESGIGGCITHKIRHSFASHLVMSGADIATIQENLGHKDIATTRIYTHVTGEHKARAVDKLTWDKKPNLKIVGSE